MRLAPLAGTRFDLLVIGGGINGAGVAAKAARRGWRVALVERHDYAAGTTSRSTRLIHGGLRYLEQGELLLVLESLREREYLLRRKPHLVRPLRFLIPVYDYSARGPLMVRAGMLLYDLLSVSKRMAWHRALRETELHELQSRWDTPGIRGAFLYYDAQVQFPERLTVETVLEAKRHGAVTMNHCEAVSLDLHEHGGAHEVRGARLRDTLAGEECRVSATLTLNLTGPWLEQLDGSLPVRRAHPLLAPTRGSHLVVAPFPGAPPHAVYFEAASDRRPMFAVPWNGLYLIGTTDLPFSGDPATIRPLPEEVAYLLAEANRVYRDAALTRDSVLYAYAGVRALPFGEGLAPGELTRRHLYIDHASADGIRGLASVIGGKLTTYRALAQDVVQRAARTLGRRHPAKAGSEVPPEYASWPWHSGSADVERAARPVASHYGVPAGEVVRLFETYGEGARAILELQRSFGSPPRRIAAGTPLTAAEVIYVTRNEQALTPADVLLRRACTAFASGRAAGQAEAVAQLMAGELGWTGAQRRAAIEACYEEIDRVLPRV